jgi:uncharacterized protein YggE
MDQPNRNASAQLHLKLDYRLLALVLLIVIAAMLFLWKPWQDNISADSRTIQVSGNATVTAVPDEFIFYPTYTFENADRDAALSALTKKSNELVSKLKSLGVNENDIKTNSDGGYYYPAYGEDDSMPSYTLRLTVTVDDRELAQKAQNYLVTTAPTGSVSPYANFSDKKRTELEKKARNEATKEARKKAEQSAENLGFKLGAVKAVNDGTGFDRYFSVDGSDMTVGSAEKPTSNLNIQPGENELNYTVTVTYFVK